MDGATVLPRRASSGRFLIAFSFAGEQRELVHPIAEVVEQRLGWGTVFYDEWFEAELAGTVVDLKLQRRYEDAEVVVFCPSADYGRKEWTLAEWDAIRARHMKLRADPDRGQADRIVPIRVGDGDVEGLLPNALWIDARQRTAKYLADLIVSRLIKFVPHAGKPCVFLAETTPELEDIQQPVNRQRLRSFLEDHCGAVVLPNRSLIELPPAEYAPALGDDLRRSLAFVQLLSRYPWRGGGFDQAQLRAAEEAGCPIFRFRGHIDLAQVEGSYPEHRKFLEANGAIAGGFEDFKQHVAEKLKVAETEAALRVRKRQEDERRARAGVPTAASTEQPLVRFAVRAGESDAVLKPVFDFLVEDEKILLDSLEPGESFVDRHAIEPCHGFLILCDHRAQSDEGLSPREALAQCRLIQTQLRNSPSLPPVALVYWPPPEPAWHRLLKSIPRSLHRVLGDSLETGLREFLVQVRSNVR